MAKRGSREKALAQRGAEDAPARRATGKKNEAVPPARPAGKPRKAAAPPARPVWPPRPAPTPAVRSAPAANPAPASPPAGSALAARPAPAANRPPAKEAHPRARDREAAIATAPPLPTTMAGPAAVPRPTPLAPPLPGGGGGAALAAGGPIAAPEPARPARSKRTAGALARAQREISVSEFFAKNRHLLGFDSPAKALLTTVKEAVDNALDACEEAGILPSIKVEIAEVIPNARYRVSVEDNGPGIVKAQVPKIFGKLLYGSKFHRLRQSLAADQPVLVEREGRVERVSIGELVDSVLGAGEEVREVTALGWRVPAFDPESWRYAWRPVSHLIRHPRRNEIVEVRTEGGKRIRVTGCHSLFTYDPDAHRIVPVEARSLRPGDSVVAPARWPPAGAASPAATIELAEVAGTRATGRRPAPPARPAAPGRSAPAAATAIALFSDTRSARDLAGSDLCLVRVERVLEVDDPHPHVYDLSVPGCENFVGGDGWLACHNSRGQQGIGISAAGLYGLMTTGKPVVITSRTSKRIPAHHFELVIDTKRNEPHVIADTVVPDWPSAHGTRVEIELAGAYKAGRRSVDEYLEQTALANPHAEFHYVPPRGRASVHLARVAETLPPEPETIKPHPHGVELGVFIRMLRDAGGRTVTGALTQDFSRVSSRVASEICAAAGIAPRTPAKRLAPAEVERLHAALQSAKLMAPTTRAVVPIGEDLIRKGLEREAPRAEFYVTRTRPPRVYRGNPFLVEVGLAYGGEAAATLDHMGAAATEGAWIAGVALEPERRVDQGLLAVPGMTRAKARELCHRAHVDPLKRAGELAVDEIERLRAAVDADMRADAASRPIELVRLANRVPLQYQQSACAITQAVIDTNWKRYGLQQARASLPLGPIVLVVHLASVWVPFTSESKEAIAHYPEIIEEVQRGLQECGRQLGAFLNKRAFARLQAARRDRIGLYAAELVEALHAITGHDRDRIRGALETAQKKHIRIDEEMEASEDGGEAEAKRARAARSEAAGGGDEVGEG